MGDFIPPRDRPGGRAAPSPPSESLKKLWAAEDRVAGLRPPLGRPRKSFPREANGQRSRRKADAIAGSDSAKWADDLWRAVALNRKYFLKPPPNPLFLNLARRCVLDRHGLHIALLWFSGLYDISGKEILRNSLSIKANIGFRKEVTFFNRKDDDELDLSGMSPTVVSIIEDFNKRQAELDGTVIQKNEGREIARTKLGDDFVQRMDDAIFNDKIPDFESFQRDLIAVRNVWRSVPSPEI